MQSPQSDLTPWTLTLNHPQSDTTPRILTLHLILARQLQLGNHFHKCKKEADER